MIDPKLTIIVDSSSVGNNDSNNGNRYNLLSTSQSIINTIIIDIITTIITSIITIIIITTILGSTLSTSASITPTPTSQQQPHCIVDTFEKFFGCIMPKSKPTSSSLAEFCSGPQEAYAPTVCLLML